MKVFAIVAYALVFIGLIAFVVLRSSALKPEPWTIPAKGGNTAQLKRLIESGLSPNAEDLKGKTPLLYALEGGNLGTATMLLSKGADPTRLNKDGKSIVQSLEETSVDPNVIFWLREKIKKLRKN